MEAKSEPHKRYSPLITAGVLLGLGFGGLFDGILLHQILQWHHMLSNVHPATNVSEAELNMVWDGCFDAATYILTLLGTIWLWRAGKRDDVPWSENIFFGSMLIGAGAFNVVEGLIDHQILGIHHVKPGPNELVWDIGFLALGAVLAIAGWILVQAGKQESTQA